MTTKREPPTPPPPSATAPSPSIRVGFGSLSVEVPKWLIDAISQRLVLLAVVALTLFNLYFTYTTRNGTALYSPSTQKLTPSDPNGAHPQTEFSKTFMFWVPDFNSPTKKLADSKVTEEQFHKMLSVTFGGWTRWRASGSGTGSTGIEDGWIYQASLPKASPDLSIRDVERLVRRHFLETSIYVIEIRHQ
jgi:hypothetical protein